MLSHLLLSVVATFRLSVAARSDLLLEIAALRHPLEVRQRSGAKPRMSRADRSLWIWLCRRWPKWREALCIVQPETVLRWHRAGFRHYWRWKTRGKVGRSRIPRAHIAFIRRISLKQQIRDACPWDDVRFLIHDNDVIYGQYGKGRGPRCALDAWLGEVMGIRGIPIPSVKATFVGRCRNIGGTTMRRDPTRESVRYRPSSMHLAM